MSNCNCLLSPYSLSPNFSRDLTFLHRQSHNRGQTFRQHPDVGLHTVLGNAFKRDTLQSQLRGLCFQIRAVLVLTGNFSLSNDFVHTESEDCGLQKRKGRRGRLEGWYQGFNTSEVSGRSKLASERLGKKREQAKILPQRQWTCWSFIWVHCSSLKGNISRKDSLEGDPQPPGAPEMMGGVEETLGERRDLIEVMTRVLWGSLEQDDSH